MSAGGARKLTALVVDDEEDLARLVADYLARDGFATQVALDGERGLELARASCPDVVVLDLMLPGIDGIEVLRQLRTFTDAYVIMLTARAEEVDKLIGLAVGADDYLTKPFSPRELAARVKAMLRRPRAQPADTEVPVRRFGDLAIDPASRQVSVGGRQVELTRLEFDLLEVLSARPRLAFSRRQLVERVWGEDWFGDEHIVDVHIVRLRRKLGDDPAHPRYVLTVRGVGYRMGPPGMNRRPGLAGRLLAAQLLAIGTGAVTFALVALAAGPPLFRTHLTAALGSVAPAVARHLDDAFAAAAASRSGSAPQPPSSRPPQSACSSPAGSPARSVPSTPPPRAWPAVTISARMQPAGLGPEIDSLTGTFNTMAAALASTEAARRRLLADAAHELRTPLATLDAFVEALADGVRAPGPDTWDVLAAQTARLRRLADDIALVSRAEEHQLALHPVPVAPGQLVTAAVAAARPGYQTKAVQLTTRLSGHLPDLAADPDRLAQVLAGLLANALRYTPPGGQVTMSAQPAGQDMHITVTDTGEGIAAEHLPHIFERFYRADTARDRAHGGSGIGLTIARALITAHGGTITAASNGPGTGAQFTITLPGTTSS